MFNFFKSKVQNDIEQQDDIVASIQYTMVRGSDKALVDVELRDYDSESIDSLCSLLDILGNDLFYIDTINMIKESFIKEKREDILVRIFTKVNSNIKSKLLNSHKEKIKDEPCIKPSDMLK